MAVKLITYDLDSPGPGLRVPDAYFESEKYAEWCAEHLPHLDEQEQFVAHFRGLMDLRIKDNS